MSALAAFMPQQTIWSLLRRGGVYVGKNTLRPASVQAVRLWRTARARSRPRPVVEKRQRSFSTASAARQGGSFLFCGGVPAHILL